MPLLTDRRPGGAGRWIPWALALAGGLLALTACTGIPESSRRLQTEEVVLEYHDVQTDNDINSLRMDHPFRISEEQMDRQLRSLYYERLSLISKPRPVFEPEQIPPLRRLLTKALRHAKRNLYISFKVAGEAGNTAGDLFASSGQLHWRLNRIEGEDYQKRDWARMEQLWRLKPRSGQRYFIKKILFEREIQNWIVAHVDLPAPRPGKGRRKPPAPRATAPPAPQAQPQPDRPPAARDAELERKLKILQNLRDKQLIDEEEYRLRRKKLLDAYF